LTAIGSEIVFCWHGNIKHLIYVSFQFSVEYQIIVKKDTPPPKKTKKQNKISIKNINKEIPAHFIISSFLTN